MEVSQFSDRGGGGIRMLRIAISSFHAQLQNFFSMFLREFIFSDCCAHLFRLIISVLFGEHSVILAFLLFDLNFDMKLLQYIAFLIGMKKQSCPK